MIISDDSIAPPAQAPRLELPPAAVCEQAKAILAKTLSPARFNSFATTMQISAITDSEAVVIVPNDFARGLLQQSVELVTQAISQVLGRSIQARITVDPDMELEYTGGISAITPAQERKAVDSAYLVLSAGTVAGQPAGGMANSNLNARYTMDRFVVSSNNQFCHSASVAVSKNPGNAYNPLFIYGGVGLGKTHLMQAIGHELLKAHPNKVVRYVPSEHFVNDVVMGIRENKMVELRRRYRTVDVLLVDDIQFIGGKEATQEEFFHTFNALRDANKQIVMTSDCPPKELKKMEERLRSRFEWGLTADIQPPDFETRLAILSKKCQIDSREMNPDVLDYIAQTYTHNVRELEGALLRLQAHSDLAGTTLDLSAAVRILSPGSELRQVGQKPTIDAVTNAVAEHFQLEPSSLRADGRSHDLTTPRHIAMFIAQEDLQVALQAIGNYFGNRKHSSVKYACDKVRAELATNAELARSISLIRRQLRV